MSKLKSTAKLEITRDVLPFVIHHTHPSIIFFLAFEARIIHELGSTCEDGED